MEIKDYELEIPTNQMAFDFEKVENNQKEESLTLPESLIKPQNHEWIKEEVLFVAVKVKNDTIVKNFYNLKICGKSMIDWILLAGIDCEEVTIDDCEDIIGKVKNIQTEKKYIAVFYSDTPLFDKGSFYRVIDYFSSRNINFLQLSRGFVVKTDYLHNNSTFIQTATDDIESQNLLQCDNARKIAYAHDVIKQKIINFHKKNGVIIFGEATVFIDADIEIDSGVVIYPNNILQGEGVIASGTVLYSGNIIKNSIISNDCKIYASYIENSKISAGKTIDAGNKIINEER